MFVAVEEKLDHDPNAVCRLLLVRHGPTPATRQRRFPADEPLDEDGLRRARGLSEVFAEASLVLSSPALRALQTARAAGFEAVPDPDLAECNFGSWVGSTFAQVWESDPAGLEAWLADPSARPHGGESLAEMLARMGRFLERASECPETTVAVAHGGPIRAAVVLALGAPAETLWRLEVDPLSVTELLHGAGGWRLARFNWRDGWRPVPLNPPDEQQPGQENGAVA